MLEGALLLERSLERVKDAADRRIVEHALEQLRDDALPAPQKHAAALDSHLAAALARHPDRTGAATLTKPLELIVDRERARFSSWYEMFPRSWGGLQGVQAQLPRLKELGFDVVYLPPIHPIGHRNRKGRNNALVAGPDDPGSPWAIGSEQGGHMAVHPDLGTVEDVEALTAAAAELDMDIALDFAIQCSADHPWLTEHPEWFNRRPDGTLKYAENPPKRYQDIYNVNWDCEDWRGLWEALLEVVRFWVDRGVRVFRVDNPHTKPVGVLGVDDPGGHRDRPGRRLPGRGVHPPRAPGRPGQGGLLAVLHVLHLAERALGARAVHRRAAHARAARGRAGEPVGPTRRTSSTSTSSTAGRRRSPARLVLAATLSPSYGIYSGYEHFENVPVRPGSEEYLDSEKYEAKQRSLDGPLLPFIQTVNEIRRSNPALQHFANITFLDTQSDGLIAYAKQAQGNTVVCVVNLDPHNAQEGLVHVPDHLGLPVAFMAHDLLTDERFGWHLGGNYVRLEPPFRQAHVLRIEGAMSDEDRPRAPTHWFEAAPKWFKTAVFYEIHLRGFFDGNGDGSGDFRGLIEKLDYLQWLGIDCIWLLPMYRSPLRDGGYDVADYEQIHEDYGTMDDVREFIDAAHQRGLRVIADFVMNHTSSDHPWFQESRSSPDSPKRDWYVWSDTVHKYEEARIIFTDTESSNWTWDDAGRRVLLAPLLQPPARPELRQPRGPRGDARRAALLARPRPRRLPPRRRALPLRARGHERREPAGDPRLPQGGPRAPSTRSTPTASCSPRRTSGRRTSSSTSARATSATWPSTSRSCPACSCRCGGRRPRRCSTSCARRRTSRRTASGASSCATTTS